MRQSDRNPKQSHTLFARTGAAIGLLLTAGLLLAAPASAGFEQVASFANSGESEQLQDSTSLAVNTTGAGGVPAGTVYVIGKRHLVARYNPDGSFSEAWGWSVSADAPLGPSAQFERCGPDGEAAHPVCGTGNFEVGEAGEGLGQLSYPLGIAVNQATGYVYVLNTPGVSREHNVIEVFSADGSQVVARFGEAGKLDTSGPFLKSIDEGPEKLYRTYESGLAVDESGAVYVTDQMVGEGLCATCRVMVFKPQSPGDYEHYIYSGEDSDIATTSEGVKYTPVVLATDSAGDLYIANNTDIFKFASGEPDTPVCQFHNAAGGIGGMTVNPETGEPFYFSFNTKKIHQLSACNGGGKFVAKSSFGMTPANPGVYGLGFNPDYSLSETRPPGTIYAADAETHLGAEPSENILGIGHIFAQAEVFSPSVESEAVSSVTPSTATLSAQINPKGSETRYAFQYLTEAEYEANEPADRFAGAAEAPVSGALLGSGQKALTGATAVVGLAPDTEYRFRAIATSHCQPDNEEAICEDVGAGKAFHTFPAEAPGLPDNRAYELVSPALKSGGEVFSLTPTQTSCKLECKPGVGAEFYPRQSAPDGEGIVYEGQPFSTTEGAPVYNQYLSKRTATGWQTTTLTPPLMGSNALGYKAFDAGLTQGLLFQTTPSLTPEAPSEYANLYSQPTADPAALAPLLLSPPPNRPTGAGLKLAYAGASADFSRLFFAANDVLTPETPFAPEALDGGPEEPNLYEWAEGELRLVNVFPGNATTAPGAHFGAPALGVVNFINTVSNLSHAISDDGSRVFWSDGTGQVYLRENGEGTIEIPDPGKFLSASADGSQVLLRNGHIYDLESEAITDLSEGLGGFQGILGQTDDLSRIYFVDTAVLTGEEENQYGDKAQAGKNNLYSWVEGDVTFIATLLPGDDTTAYGGAWHFSPPQRDAQASPDGRWLAFLSRAPLTGYDNVGAAEVFLYDAGSGELNCPSCNPTHQAPLGSSSLPILQQTGGKEDPLSQPTYLTDQGRLYFDSRDSLSPFDTNDGVEDVYQYEPDGVGTCKREGGCVNLISAGHEPIDSNFLAVDETGKNVFFTTRDQLVLKDRDELIDLYVAREDGGIGAETETARSECQGEACQPLVIVPNDPTPGSSTFEGAGNVKESKAKKKQAKKHKKQAKKKQSKKQKKNAKKSKRAKHNRGGAR